MKRRIRNTAATRPKDLRPLPYLNEEVFLPLLPRPSPEPEDIEQFSSPERPSKKAPQVTQSTIEDSFAQEMGDYVNWDGDEESQPLDTLVTESSQPSRTQAQSQERLGEVPPLSPEVPVMYAIHEPPATSTTQHAEADSQSLIYREQATQATDLHSALCEVDQQMEDVNNEIAELQRVLQGLGQSDTQAGAVLSKHIKALCAERDEKSKQCSSLEDQIVELELHVDQLKMTGDSYQSQIARLTAELEDRTEQVSQLEDAVAELHMEMATLQEENERLADAAAQKVVPGERDPRGPAQDQQDRGALHAAAERLAALEQELEHARQELAAAQTDASARAEELAVERQRSDEDLRTTQSDRDFFRGLYEQASVHAQRLAGENTELELRVAALETQRTDGLAMVQATYQNEAEALRAEVERLQDICKVMRDQDERTGLEVRRRAAMEPELREEVERLTEQLQLAHEKMNTMEADIARMLVAAQLALAVKEGGDEEDGEYVPGNDGSSPSDSTSNASAEDGAALLQAAAHSQGSLVRQAHVSRGVMCNRTFPSAQDVIDHAWSTHYKDGEVLSM
ncbi:uncharacterized protein BXZ73DRAFT_73783 [Epithele typhae]|uniref:uncharacterized protein n=1 Tax=Epithele typhae TaxID=378194 RepID=UPI00200820CC|nr:uncharacterized protein BXZ73DRAFT_73783 [Epithele typhae]KAH9944209.1 hypothetical protein BXZ73DRAFT_73783 [Epithele typhae]